MATSCIDRSGHAVLHIGRVPNAAGGFDTRLAVLVKPNGLLGNAYMAFIRPFRHLIVYPAVLRETTETLRSGREREESSSG